MHIAFVWGLRMIDRDGSVMMVLERNRGKVVTGVEGEARMGGQI